MEEEQEEQGGAEEMFRAGFLAPLIRDPNKIRIALMHAS